MVSTPFTADMSRYEGYGDPRGATDGLEGRLVALHCFTEPWGSREVHPDEAEVVVCVAGRMTLHREDPDGSTRTVVLEEGQGVINQPGMRHTADVDAPATALFITGGRDASSAPVTARASGIALFGRAVAIDGGVAGDEAEPLVEAVGGLAGRA